MIGFRGMGADYNIDSSGNTIDCDLWSNIANLACWGFPGSATVPTGNVVNSPSLGSTVNSVVWLGVGAVAFILLIGMVKR